MQSIRRSMSLLALLSGLACQSTGGAAPSGFSQQLAGTRAMGGLLDLHVHGEQGKAWLVLPAPGARGVALECLYSEGLTSGLGSNDVGLDRGQLGPAQVVSFRIVGERVLVEAANLAFRADTTNVDEQTAARESFATSVLWASEVAARGADGRVLVDFTGFLVRDAHGVSRTLRSAGQGTWDLDLKRSTLDPSASLSFPDNVELEAILTFRGSSPGQHVRATAPDAHSLTLTQHHSFIRLPDDGYETRPQDPRTGAWSVSFLDYAVPLDEAVERRFAVRHRLKKTRPELEVSPVEEPIVYFVDRGAPEPIRSALIEGASWWAPAFEAAGFADGFRVELLPEGVHPLDARYNVIQWVHRSTRGWSYGGGIVDPRTGEMLKGHVNLGSLRVRQDRRLFEGLVGTARTGSGSAEDPIELALARIRQLAAHEVGHTLGLQHNFAASTYGGRASVMDYPAPLVRVRDGQLDLADAYATGVGSWDMHAIRCLHADSPTGQDVGEFVDGLAQAGLEAGHLYLSDEDARPSGAAHPLASLWDNGSDPAQALLDGLEVRRIAMANFGPANLRAGRPLAELQEVFAPLYFHHRYQLDAALKAIGGFSYRHSVAGDGREPARMVAGATQRASLDAVLEVLDPARLDIPESVLQHLLPRPPGERPNREMFRGHTDPGVDALELARSAASAVFAGLLQPERLNRIVDFERRGGDGPGLEELLGRLSAATLGAPDADDARLLGVQRAVRDRFVEQWLGALVHPDLSGEARVRLEALLMLEMRAMAARTAGDSATPEARRLARIDGFLERPWSEGISPSPAPESPPGSPIGNPSRACSFDSGWRASGRN